MLVVPRPGAASVALRSSTLTIEMWKAELELVTTGAALPLGGGDVSRSVGHIRDQHVPVN